MSLARVQAAFLDAVLSEREPEDAAMAVYHRTALAARRDALAAAYPVVRRLVGGAFFDEAAARFAFATPSRCGDLHAYGGGFPDFLARYAPARPLEYLPDVARLEWAVHECSRAPDGAALDARALAALPAEVLPRLELPLHPAARLVASPWPVLAIWEANQPERDGTPQRGEGSDRVLVRRVGWEAVPVAVDEDAWALLEAFARGLTLGQACATLGRDQAFPGALARLAAWGAFGGHRLAEP